jgi:hypothetical protein
MPTRYLLLVKEVKEYSLRENFHITCPSCVVECTQNGQIFGTCGNSCTFNPFTCIRAEFRIAPKFVWVFNANCDGTMYKWACMKPTQWRVHNLLSKIAMPFVHVFLLFSKHAYFSIDAGVFSIYVFKYFRVFWLHSYSWIYRVIHVRWRAWPGKNATQNRFDKAYIVFWHLKIKSGIQIAIPLILKIHRLS